MKENFFSLTIEDLERFFLKEDVPQYRKKQLLDWVFKKKKIDFEDFSNIPKDFRSKISINFKFALPIIKKKLVANDGSVKFLLALEDGGFIESVIIAGKGKNTLCVSSQLGCRFSCLFCATASLGFVRNLDLGEIIGQVYLGQKFLEDRGDKLSNLVFMGMGEPLDNVTNLIDAVKILQHNDYFCFSPRRITVSTCGIVPGIKELSNTGIKLKLAVSINSALQKQRDLLMPVSKKYDLESLKKSLIELQRKNPFRITLEYVIFKQFNTSQKNVKALCRFVEGLDCKINLIPYNSISKLVQFSGSSLLTELGEPGEEEVNSFIRMLLPLKAAITLRRSKGYEIAAACGQLTGKNSCENFEESEEL